ncbi:hypothetical protein HanRHA438_Chr07g0309401 [Helianthus annuus]|nr:hypothetical protein HanRHA438_Chr07g0309401 [Helianthus annuus]
MRHWLYLCFVFALSLGLCRNEDFALVTAPETRSHRSPTIRIGTYKWYQSVRLDFLLKTEFPV